MDGDIELAKSLHSDDYQLITPGGRTQSREEYLGSIASGGLNYVVFEPASDIAVYDYGQAAVVRYKARIEVRYEAEVDADLFWHTDLYEYRDARWQAVWSHATRIKR